jgi:hypothetical protein
MRVLPDRRPRLALESHVRHAFQTLRVTLRHELASWTAREHEADRSPRYLDDWRCIGRWQTHPPLPQLPWGHLAPSKIGVKDRAVAGVVDLTRDERGKVHAGLLDVAPGRSGTAYTTWLQQQSAEFVAGIAHAALDPFRGMPTPSGTSCPTPSREVGWVGD